MGKIVEILEQVESDVVKRDAEIASLDAQIAALREAGRPAILAIARRVLAAFGTELSNGKRVMRITAYYDNVTADRLADLLLGDDCVNVLSLLVDRMRDESSEMQTTHARRLVARTARVRTITDLIRATSESSQ